jgi:nucleoside-diphosphate-sugar epimerase
MEIQGTAALVTGGASGLGRASAERFAAAGAHVTIVDLPTSQGEAIAGKPGNAAFAAADVTDEDAISAALAGIAGRGIEAKKSLGAQVPHQKRLGAPAEYARLAEAIVTNPMLNGETIRLDGSIRMAAR